DRSSAVFLDHNRGMGFHDLLSSRAPFEASRPFALRKKEITVKLFAHSALSLPIFRYDFGHSGRKVLILGGVHGDENEGVVAAHGLLEAFTKSFAYRLQVTVIPNFNADGVLLRIRGNGHGVDLNRN